MLFLLATALAGPPKLANVGDALAKAISKQTDGRCVHDPTELSVRCDDGTLLSLAPLLMEYRAADKPRRQDLFEAWTSLPSRSKALEAEFRQNLRPILKSRTERMAMKHQLRALGGMAAPRPHYALTHTLSLSLALDSKTTTELISINDLKRNHLSLPEAIALATQNLASLPFAPAELSDGLYMVTTFDSYDSARVLLTDALRSLDLDGEPVVLVAARDLLFVTGSDSPEHLSQLLEISIRTTQDPDLAHRVSLIPILLQDDQWTDLTLPKDHPSHLALETLRRLQMGQWYFDQRHSLQAMFDAIDNPTLIAGLSGIERNDGTAAHLVTPSLGSILLPRADYVAIPRGKKEVRLVSWDDFVRISGTSLQEEPNTFPPLYRADGDVLFTDSQRYKEVWTTLKEVAKQGQ